jgi:hypothetical protein
MSGVGLKRILRVIVAAAALTTGGGAAADPGGGHVVRAVRQPLTTDRHSSVVHDNEVMSLAPHAGRLFAATDQWEYAGRSPHGQILVKRSARSRWTVFEQTQSLRVQALDSFPVPPDQGLGRRHALLITQAIIAGHSEIQWLLDGASSFPHDDAYVLPAGADVRSFGAHESGGVWAVYAGAEPTGVLRGTWSRRKHRLVFDRHPELVAARPGSPGLKTQKITGFADCGGALYASINTKLFRRNDGALPSGVARWVLVYQAPPVGAYNSGLRGLSCIRHRGAPALLVSTEGNGNVYRLDRLPRGQIHAPAGAAPGHGVSGLVPVLEFSPIPAIRQMLAGQGTAIPASGPGAIGYVIAAYNDFETIRLGGAQRQLFGFEWGYAGACPATRTCGPTAFGAIHFDARACFAVRTDRGSSQTYALRCLAGPSMTPSGPRDAPVRSGQAFVSIRTIKPSPFRDGRIYYAGYDCNFYPADGAAWIATTTTGTLHLSTTPLPTAMRSARVADGGRGRASPVPPSERQAEKVGTDAYVYGIALMEFLRLEREQTSVTAPTPFGFAPVNQLSNQRRLTTAAHQPNVQANDDTLYTLAHLELSRGPMVLHVPRLRGGRYYVFQLVDPYTNDFAYIGTRTTGNRGGDFAIIGPAFRGRLPAGVTRIRSSYDRVWMVGRTLVYGSTDVPAVHRIQNAYRLIPLRQYNRFGLRWRPPRPKRIITVPRRATVPTGIAFFDALGTALKHNPPPTRDRPILRELATEGIGPGRHPSHEQLDPAVVAGLARAADKGPAKLLQLRDLDAVRSAAAHDGWYVPPPAIGSFGRNYPLRAVVAVNGIGANRPAEATYAVGIESSTGALLSGGHRYLLHFDAGQLPPARYFWSVTIYNPAFRLIANPINRYSIGDRSPGLRYNADGSLDIYIQAAAVPGRIANWLPSPATGQFELTLRMYGPRPSVLRNRYRYPTITETG